MLKIFLLFLFMGMLPSSLEFSSISPFLNFAQATTDSTVTPLVISSGAVTTPAERCSIKNEDFKSALNKVPSACREDSDSDKCLAYVSCENDALDEDEEDIECKKYSEEDLDELRDETKDFKDRKKDLMEDLEDAEEEIVEVKGSMTTAQTEYEEERVGLQNKTDTAKKDLEEGLREAKTRLDKTTNEQISKIQKQLNQSLKIRHTFENAVSNAGTRKRKAILDLMQRCRNEATIKTSNYVAKRRKALRRGLNKKSALKMLRKNRVSLKTKDAKRTQYYYNTCWKNSRTTLSEIKAEHKETLKRIAQQKNEMVKKFHDLQKKAGELNNSAYAKKKALVVEYSKNLETTLREFNRNQQTLTKKYQAEIKNLNEKLNYQDQKRGRADLRLMEKSHVIHANKFIVAKMKDAQKKQSELDLINEANTQKSVAIATCCHLGDKVTSATKHICENLGGSAKASAGSTAKKETPVNEPSGGR